MKNIDFEKYYTLLPVKVTSRVRRLSAWQRGVFWGVFLARVCIRLRESGRIVDVPAYLADGLQVLGNLPAGVVSRDIVGALARGALLAVDTERAFQ